MGGAVRRSLRAQLELYLAMLGTPKAKAETKDDKPPPNLPAPDVKPAPKGGGGRKPLPDNLPVVVVEIPVPDAERACPYCGKERTSCGHEVARLIEYFPPSFKVIEERREKLVCRPCGEITTAPLGDRVIEGGRPGPQLVAALIVDKWQDATPHNRNADIFSRLGVHFARQRLTEWAAAGLDALGSGRLVHHPARARRDLSEYRRHRPARARTRSPGGRQARAHVGDGRV